MHLHDSGRGGGAVGRMFASASLAFRAAVELQGRRFGWVCSIHMLQDGLWAPRRLPGTHYELAI